MHARPSLWFGHLPHAKGKRRQAAALQKLALVRTGLLMGFALRRVLFGRLLVHEIWVASKPLLRERIYQWLRRLVNALWVGLAKFNDETFDEICPLKRWECGDFVDELSDGHRHGGSVELRLVWSINGA